MYGGLSSMATQLPGSPHQMPARFNTSEPARIHRSDGHAQARASHRRTGARPERASDAAARTSRPTQTHSLSASARSSAARAISRGTLRIFRGRSAQPGTGASGSLIARPQEVESDGTAAVRVVQLQLVRAGREVYGTRDHLSVDQQGGRLVGVDRECVGAVPQRSDRPGPSFAEGVGRRSVPLLEQMVGRWVVVERGAGRRSRLGVVREEFGGQTQRHRIETRGRAERHHHRRGDGDGDDESGSHGTLQEKFAASSGLPVPFHRATCG